MVNEEFAEAEKNASGEVRSIVRQVIEEFVRSENQKSEPAYKVELQEERRRREGLEARVNQLVEENRRTKAAADAAEKDSTIRAELQRLGVAKVDLAFRAVRDEIVKTDDGRLLAKGEGKSMQDYLSHFVQENPELLPARISGGSGAAVTSRQAQHSGTGGFELDKIKPGMNKEDLERARQEISRLAIQALRGA